jgi:hypothetical protein
MYGVSAILNTGQPQKTLASRAAHLLHLPFLHTILNIAANKLNGRATPNILAPSNFGTFSKRLFSPFDHSIALP